MEITSQLVERIAKHEGCRLKAYQDSMGIWTIGFGRNLEALGYSPEEACKMTCTMEEALQWLRQDIEEALKDAESTPEWKYLDTDNRKGVWVEMVFNLGLPKLLKFVGTRAAIRDQDWPRVAKHMLDSLWARQVKGRAKRLANIMVSG